jgi:PAS domain-containing protein
MEPTRAASASTRPSIPTAVLRYDRSHRVRYASPGASEIFGVPVEQLLGRTIAQTERAAWCGGWYIAVADVFVSGKPRVLECPWPREAGGRHYHSVLLPEFFPADWVGSVLELVYDRTGGPPD